MSSTNKKGAGLILSLLTAVAGAVGLAFCIVNAGTDSFRKIGTSPVVIGCAVIAILALVLRVVLDKKLAIAADAMSVVCRYHAGRGCRTVHQPPRQHHRLDHDLYEQRPDDG